MLERFIGDLVFAAEFIVAFYLATLILQTLGDMLP